MAFTVFVDGQEGTTGLRINEYLVQRRDVEVLRIAPDRRKDNAERARLLNAADTPDAELAALKARQPTGRLVAMEEVAHAIAYLASPHAASVTGTELAVDGGMSGQTRSGGRIWSSRANAAASWVAQGQLVSILIRT